MKEEDLVFTDMWGKKMRPIEWLQHLADSFMGLASMWPDYDFDYFDYYFERYKAKNTKISRIELYEKTTQNISEHLLHDLCHESDSTVAIIMHGENKRCLLQAFEGSEAFASILDAMVTIERVIHDAKLTEDIFWFKLYYSCVSTPEEAEERFGEGRLEGVAAKRHRKNSELTADDYEKAFEHITMLLKYVKESNFVEELRQSARRINAYCKLKLGTSEYEQTEAELARRFDLAYKSYQYAEEKLNEAPSDEQTITDKQAYYYLGEHGFKGADDYKLPDFDTWQRYVRRARSEHGTQKNTPRAARRYGRSVVKSDQIQSISEISSQYTEED